MCGGKKTNCEVREVCVAEGPAVQDADAGSSSLLKLSPSLSNHRGNLPKGILG